MNARTRRVELSRTTRALGKRLLRFVLLLSAAVAGVVTVIAGCITGLLLHIRVTGDGWSPPEAAMLQSSAAVAATALLGTIACLTCARFLGDENEQSLRLVSAPDVAGEARVLQVCNVIALLAGAALLWSSCRAAGELLGVLLALMWIALLIAAIFLRILWHEIGHLVAGRLAGMVPFKLQVGIGREILRLRDRSGCTWEFRLQPDFGFVFALPSAQRWRQMVFIAGGPLADALLVAIAYHFGVRLASPTWWPGASTAALLFFVLTTSTALAGLVPMQIPFGGARVATDALQLLRLLRSRSSQEQPWLA